MKFRKDRGEGELQIRLATVSLADLTGFGFPAPTSDQRAVWVDVTVPTN